MAEQTSTQAVADAINKAGKYLTFCLGKEQYGLEILKVREIIGLMSITAVPRTPDYVKGVINLRGKVIPIVCLRRKFEMDQVEDTDQTCVIVVDVHGTEMGIIVDQVSEVLDIAEEEIEDAPSFGASVNTDFILGMGKAGNRVTILLNICRVLSSQEVSALEAIASA